MQGAYFYEKQPHMELVLCRHSDFSYPLHNHVSVYTIGLVLEGAALVTAGGESRPCRSGESFAIAPYAPHLIQPQSRYTLLSLCIDKNAVSPETLPGIKKALPPLLERAAAGSHARQLLPLLDALGTLPCPADETPA